ncbi:MAG TPA: bifunctional aldolase/short-chain dehydrogenase [Xanthobacteraceae bacterium]|jgi:rhamnose utilization protein RhaD (predicted bifunctional aldolase and dehydrogenase)/NAD(P)-dependent dehydrogenase (short-subunit alcohol dehydrogenase family)|nr:bifunctional aldolase/short-chain dehydrogenase [Xanthobacteraceae bacterium]
MKSGWVDRDAEAIVADGAKAGIGRDLALRVYTTRLLGRDPKLVLHGGGNTSLKAKMRDRLGAEVEVLRVKASGIDMATITPDGLPAVRLEPMRKLRLLAAIDGEELLGIERANMIDPGAPNPSVEMMLHAFLPHKFVDHTHATAVLSLIDQPRGEQICGEVFAGRMAFVPYLMPGFGLAKKAIEVFEAASGCEGLILSKHGLVTFGETAREAYERMIALVSRAEDFIARNRKSVAAAPSPIKTAPVAEVAPIVRGACSEQDENSEGAWRRLVLEFRNGDAVVDFVNGKDSQRLSEAGVITPDHTIRTKNWPLVLGAPQSEKLAEFAQAARRSVQAFTTRYRDYFARHNKRTGGHKSPLDPLPRVVLVPRLGLFGLGRSKKDSVIAADIAEAWLECLRDAEAIGRFESISEADMFDCEYWPLEQAKLGARREPPLAGQVAAVTGAGGAIGAATAKAFAAAGAEVALLDVDRAAAREQANALGAQALALACDVTDAGSVSAAFDKIAEHFGGVDIVVSNAGAAWQGRIGEVDEEILHQSFELNFYGHQRVAQAAVRIMRAQGTGGCLLFNISKQAVNPGPNFGPYGIPKAAALALMRQYALDYGGDGIRANAVNADRIRSGLLTPALVASRAKVRGLSEKDYMTGNLLGREVTAEDVAQAFLHQALALKTTADVTTVDGGNIAAAMR